MFDEAGKRGLGRIIVINKMDADNVDFPALVDEFQELFGKACIPFNVPIGHGADFKGVASTLDAAGRQGRGALIDPERIHDTLVEAIIEVDDAVTERYFEGTMPTAEETVTIDRRGRGRGQPDSDVSRVGQNGRGID